ncbi:TPA: hypothetical protein ACJ509_001692 [Stenotrophomonas maltophilia]
MARTSLPTRCTAIAAALLLAACGDKQDNPADGAPPAAEAATSTTPADAKDAPVAVALPQPDPGKPLAEYNPLDSGQQLMFLYTALSQLPPDFEQIATAASQEYRNTADTFRRKDLMTALQPQLQQSIAAAARSPYYRVEGDADLKPYDFERKGFPVGVYSGNRFHYFHDLPAYNYTLTNAAQVALAPVADEGAARAIEGLRSHWNTQPRVRTYFFAQSVDLNRREVNAVVTRVELLDRSGKVVASYAPDTRVALPAAAPADDGDCVNDPGACAMRAAGG